MRAADGATIVGEVAAAAPYENMSKGLWLDDDMRSIEDTSLMRSGEFQVGMQWRVSSYPRGVSNFYNLYLFCEIGMGSNGEGGRGERKFR